MKVLRNKASQKDSSDFIREVQNMIELESKQQCPYIIKLRGVAKGRLNFISKVALDKFFYNVLNHLMFHDKSSRQLSLAKLPALACSGGRN